MQFSVEIYEIICKFHRSNYFINSINYAINPVQLSHQSNPITSPIHQFFNEKHLEELRGFHTEGGLVYDVDERGEDRVALVADPL